MIKKELISLAEFKEAERYWLEKLTNDIHPARFIDDSRQTGDYEKATWSATFPPGWCDKLLQVSKGNDLSLFIVLLAGFKLLLFKYLQIHDIAMGSSIYNASNRRYNKYVILRDQVDPDETFKSFLMKVKQTVVKGYEHEYYPTRNLLTRLEEVHGFINSAGLFSIALILENIHPREWVNDLLEDFHHTNELILCAKRTENGVAVDFFYNARVISPNTLQRIWNGYVQLLGQVLQNTSMVVSQLELISAEEKEEILHGFNQTASAYPSQLRLHEWFEERVEKSPGAIALRVSADWLPLSMPRQNLDLVATGMDCFLATEWVRLQKSQLFLEFLGLPSLVVLRTPGKDYAAVPAFIPALLELLDGTVNLRSLVQALDHERGNVTLYHITPANTPGRFDISTREVILDGTLPGVTDLMQALLAFHLVRWTGFRSGDKETRLDLKQVAMTGQNHCQCLEKTGTPVSEKTINNKTKTPVLLLGDTAGTASTGILYLASFLKRKGIEAFCRWNTIDTENTQLKNDIENLLRTLSPRIIGISMKWFLHMSRVLEICRTVKNYDPTIDIVIGGNSASFYWKDLVKHAYFNYIDYIIRGDGEIPLYLLCSGHDVSTIPNLVYKNKTNGTFVENPFQYVQDSADNNDMVLSHLDEIFVSAVEPCLADYFYICTGKGCSQQCFYCAGCRDVQVQSFNRAKPFLRDIQHVRQDIRTVMPYTTTFMFDFDLPLYDSLEYYRSLWEGIDLTNHFCEFYFWKLPSPGFIDLVSRTFRHVELGIDICSLSERHRLQLSAMTVVKPQPTDQDILAFFENCEAFPNVRVKITQVLGLPGLTDDDIQVSEAFFNRLLHTYTCFSGMEWSRLHAQPGAPILPDCNHYQMNSFATSFQEFLDFSQKNLELDHYPDLENVNYPYIYFNDEHFNSRLSAHYGRINRRLEQLRHKRENCPLPLRLDKFKPFLTYQQLNENANHLALYLQNRGIKQGTIVAIWVQHSLILITAILAVLKTGAAYLPLDINLPPARLQEILKDSAALLLTQTSAWNKNPGLSQWLPRESLFYIDDESLLAYDKKMDSSLNTNLESHGSATDPAYVIYTSGTTGQPKGIMVRHQGVVNYTSWRLTAYNYTADDVTLQLLSPSFDGYNSNLYSSLFSGGQLVLVPDFKAQPLEEICEMFPAFKITNLSLVPGLYDALLESTGNHNFQTLRFAVLAGEKAGGALIRKSIAKLPAVKLANEYGPTETSVTATAHPGIDPGNTSIIGTPIANTRIYILDHYFKILPIGISGEIYIAGHGVAMGYLNNPRLTWERFIDDPFVYSHSPNEKMYKSGDLARWMPDGRIEFSGRCDHQIKIRGYRIELKEIRERLAQHEYIKDIVVIDQPNEEGETLLVAYFVPHLDRCPQDCAATFNQYLAPVLPDYMIPAYFIKLERIPLTANGKLDREALPKPGPAQTPNASISLPRNSQEELLENIWMEVLNIDRAQDGKGIGIDASFFELGGHSLKATKLASLIQEKLQVPVPVAQFFKTPTIRGLSDFLQVTLHAATSDIPPLEKQEYYPLSSAQKRLFLHVQLTGGNTRDYNMPGSFIIEGNLDKQRFENAIYGIIQRHEALRTSFRSINAQPVQIIHDHVEFHIQYHPSSMANVKEYLDSFVRPFPLDQAPLFRVQLLNLETSQYILMFDMHHIICDGMSMELLVKDFAAFYEGKTPKPLRIQYKDFASWQNSFIGSRKFLQQEQSWLRTLNGFHLTCLPRDYTSTNLTPGGKKENLVIAQPLFNQINDFCRHRGITKFTFMIAIFNIILARETSQDDITIGIPLVTRDHYDLKNIMGIFLNVVLVRSLIKKDSTFLDVLTAMKTTVVQAVENQDYPYELLDYKLRNQPGNHFNDRDELFTILFNYFPADANLTLSSSGLTINPYQSGEVYPKYDLTLYIVEAPHFFSLSAVYKSDLYSPYRIRRIMDYFLEAVSRAVVNENTRLQDILPAALPGMANFDEQFEDF